MNIQKLLKNSIVVLCGFALGFMLTMMFSHKYSLFVPKELLKPGVFGNTSIKLMKLAPILRDELSTVFLENPQEEALWCFSNQRLFAIIPMFKDETIKGFVVMDGLDRILAASRLNNGVFSNLQVMTDNDARRGGLHIVPCNGPAGLRLYYAKAQNGIPTGDGYTDIDLNGQFDIKTIFDQNGKVASKWISLDLQWEKVDWYDEDNGIAGFGPRGEKAAYGFEYYHGWKLSNSR